MFYDYGTLKTYSPDAVYYLHKRFSILPAQAIPCGLINTRPCTGSKWSRSATHHFALRTSDIPLVATIATINKEVKIFKKFKYLFFVIYILIKFVLK